MKKPLIKIDKKRKQLTHNIKDLYQGEFGEIIKIDITDFYMPGWRYEMLVDTPSGELQVHKLYFLDEEPELETESSEDVPELPEVPEVEIPDIEDDEDDENNGNNGNYENEQLQKLTEKYEEAVELIKEINYLSSGSGGVATLMEGVIEDENNSKNENEFEEPQLPEQPEQPQQILKWYVTKDLTKEWGWHNIQLKCFMKLETASLQNPITETTVSCRSAIAPLYINQSLA